MKSFKEWWQRDEYNKLGTAEEIAQNSWDACAAEHQKLLVLYRDMLTSMENLILKVIELHPEIKDKL